MKEVGRRRSPSWIHWSDRLSKMKPTRFPLSASKHHPFKSFGLVAGYLVFCRTPPTNSFDSRCSSLTLSPNQSSNSHRSSLTLSPNQSCNFHRSSLTLSPNLSHQPILQFSSVQLDAVAQPISSVALT
ncbi:hypothetical protein MJO28_005871 [Puccinia striiformis f. sp. tritici]|uniref:Uncharacterized protein n=1 Tax=Puccinia striiformis f. sp. tritici TaxID=168172 RepID=A0ACC0EFU4_9BASI|nr:hypothetical protein Pst134EB_012068 [Puccinia striiformis f. sp. tritici]KAI7953324.1 hypothetical protein MJO28_005871 [Puccinia striiformis f. sp. tritici]KAI7957671.1 hypothetical protein MJO29_005888 [Puccinia striiformis f. sp. tritici]